MASQTIAKNITIVPTGAPTITTTKRDFVEFQSCLQLVHEKPTQPRHNNKKPITSQPRHNNKKPTSPTPNKFVVDSSLISQLKHQSREVQIKKNQDMISSQLKDLGDTSQEFSLDGKFTRICRAIAKQPDGKWGVCTREWCTFAHCFDELKDPLCSWNDRCNNYYGQNPKRECSHRHTCESRQEYYKRTNKFEECPCPQTSELTRNPSKQVFTEKHTSKNTQQIKHFVKTQPSVPSPPIITPTPFHSPEIKNTTPAISTLKPLKPLKPLKLTPSYKHTTEQVVETTCDGVMEVVEMMKKKGIAKYTIKVI